MTPQLLLLAVISFLTAYMVSAGEQWSAIYTSQTLGAGATLGAATYTGWVLANATGLLVVDRLTARVGLLRFFCVSTVVAAATLAVALVFGTAAAAIAGFVLLGLCTIGIAPLLNGVAALQPGLTPGEALSVVQLGQPPGFLLSPVLIGVIAGAISLRIALATVVAALLLAAALATRLRASHGWMTNARLHEHEFST